MKENDWNEFVITAQGQHVTIELNGTRIVDHEDPKFNKEGIIGLQLHVGYPMEVRYKDIEIMELSKPAPAARTKARQPSARRPGNRRAVIHHPAYAKEFHGKFFKVFPYQLSWHEAQLKCLELGGHLAVVKSEDENQFLMSQMKSQGVSVVWLGATDEKVEGRWVWVDGEPLRYSNWNPTQPNNKQGLEHYMIMMAGNSVAISRGAQDGKWHDQPNNSAQWSPGFICQWEE